MALLLISHDLDLMAARVERLAVMYAGRIVERGGAREVFTAPAHPYTRGLLAARPTRERSARLPTIRGRVPALHEMPLGCAFAARCDLARDDCRAAPPPELEAEPPTHAVRCLHWREKVPA
jgi:peptide/nickel transport system ATP-binding protein